MAAFAQPPLQTNDPKAPAKTARFPGSSQFQVYAHPSMQTRRDGQKEAMEVISFKPLEKAWSPLGYS